MEKTIWKYCVWSLDYSCFYPSTTENVAIYVTIMKFQSTHFVVISIRVYKGVLACASFKVAILLAEVDGQ